MAKIYRCEKCNFVTDKKQKCIVCGGKTVETKKSQLKFDQVLVAGKRKDEVPSAKVKRFPREISAAEKANAATIATIERKCLEFDSPGHIVNVIPGPVVTQFNFALDRYVRVKRVRGMSEDLASALGHDNVTITKVPGEPSVVAVMVPNKDRKLPTYDQSLASYLKFRKEMEIPLNLGVDSMGTPVIADLAQLPHLVIAGETNAGKSVLLHSIITSLLYARSPKQIQFLLIDTKKVELTKYRDLPHLKTATVTDIWGSLKYMEQLEQEMRYRLTFIGDKNCQNLKELNSKLPENERKPYIIMIIDELADLVLTEKKAFTEQLAILAGMARAAGVHIIAATQRPSVDVLSGKIKVNFPARIGLHVPSASDSKTILGTKGCEQLSAKGDAFAILPNRSGLTRLHTPFCQNEDITKMMKASIAVGHTLRVPADMSSKEIKQLEADMEARKNAVNKAQGTSIADAMESPSGTAKPN